MCKKFWRPSQGSTNISKIKVTQRYPAERKVSKSFTPNRNVAIWEGRVELDSHADTFVAGRNCLLMHYTERCCNVMPYSEDYKAKTNVPIVQVATGYTSMNGDRFILVFNEAIWIPGLQNSLMDPNKFKDFGI